MSGGEREGGREGGERERGREEEREGERRGGRVKWDHCNPVGGLERWEREEQSKCMMHCMYVLSKQVHSLAVSLRQVRCEGREVAIHLL